MGQMSQQCPHFFTWVFMEYMKAADIEVYYFPPYCTH